MRTLVSNPIVNDDNGENERKGGYIALDLVFFHRKGRIPLDFLIARF